MIARKAGAAPRDIIDLHAHCVPRAIYDRINDAGEAYGITVRHTDNGPQWSFDDGFTCAPIEPLLVDLDARVARMDAAGVQVQLLSSYIDIGAHHADEHGVEYARAFNEALQDTVAAHPGRFLGLGTLPLHDPPAAVHELQVLIREGGFVGVEVPASCAGDARLEPVWAEAAALGALVLVHPESATTSTLPYFVGNFVANPAETTAAAEILILSGVLERHPGLSVILVHGGGFLPYQFGRLEHGHLTYGGRFGATARVSPREQLRRFHYDTVLHDCGPLEYLIETVGYDRVVAGTDDPFLMADGDPGRTIAGLSRLDDEQRRAIRHGNARRLIEAVANDSWSRLVDARQE